MADAALSAFLQIIFEIIASPDLHKDIANLRSSLFTILGALTDAVERRQKDVGLKDVAAYDAVNIFVWGAEGLCHAAPGGQHQSDFFFMFWGRLWLFFLAFHLGFGLLELRLCLFLLCQEAADGVVLVGHSLLMDPTIVSSGLRDNIISLVVEAVDETAIDQLKRRIELDQISMQGESINANGGTAISKNDGRASRICPRSAAENYMISSLRRKRKFKIWKLNLKITEKGSGMNWKGGKLTHREERWELFSHNSLRGGNHHDICSNIPCDHGKLIGYLEMAKGSN
ncbi:hypothetical protein ACLOJK_023875 [Asimina triloba]